MRNWRLTASAAATFALPATAAVTYGGHLTGAGDAIDLAPLVEENGRGIGVTANGFYFKERRFLNRRWFALVCDAT